MSAIQQTISKAITQLGFSIKDTIKESIRDKVIVSEDMFKKHEGEEFGMFGSIMDRMNNNDRMLIDIQQRQLEDRKILDDHHQKLKKHAYHIKFLYGLFAIIFVIQIIIKLVS